MQQQPQTIYGPNGERADWNGREYVVASPAVPASQAGAGFRLQPMTTPAEQRAREEREYDRSRDVVRDDRADRTEQRAIEAATRSADAADRTAAKLTEDQGKAGGYAQLMADAERSYQQALEQGFNPTGFSAGLANFTDNIPMMGGVGNFIRDDAGDRARQAELQWSDAQLKAMSGAASPEQEVARNNITFFARPGQNYDAIGERLEDARRVAFESSRRRAGQDLQGLAYPDTDPVASTAPARPGADAASAVNYRDPNSREALAALIAEGGWIRDGDGEPYQVGPGGIAVGPTRPGDEQTAPGVAMRPQESPDDAQARYREDVTGADRQAAGFMRGVVDTATFGLSDEIGGAIDTVLPSMGGQRSGWEDGFGDAYRQNVQNYRAFADADQEDVGGARIAGQIGGAFIPGTQIIGAARGANLATRVGRGVAAGAAYGGAYGFGSDTGNALQRGDGAAKGAAVGALAGGASPLALNLAGRVAAPVGNALSDAGRFVGRQGVNALGDNAPEALRAATQPNHLTRGLERFAGTNRPDINALNATREQLEGAVGRPVAAASVVNTGGRAMLRGVATRSDGAREIAENFGQGTAEALPARVGQQGRRILSNDTRSPDDIRAALDAERSNMARTTYAEPYAQPVEIGEDIAGALSGAPGRAAIQRARSAAEAWQDTAVMAELDALDAAARAGQPLPQVSAGAVDRIRQAMSGRGEKLAQNPATRAVGAGVQNRAGQVDGALDNVEGLAPARAAYRDTSRQIDAVDAGERFMGSAPDQVAADMRGAPASAQAPFRAGAARSIERAAGSTQTAPGVANRLAIPGTPQRQMMDETLGVDDARRLSDAMRGERDIYRGAQQVDPGVGSQTTNNAMKAGEAAGLVGDVVGGRPLGAVRRVVGLLDSRGFNPQQAEAVLQAMTDPSRTDEVISILSQRMSRREARNLTRALRYQLTIGPQSGQQN